MKKNRKMKFIILTFICISLIVWVTFMQTNQRNIFVSKIDEEKKAVIDTPWAVYVNGTQIDTFAEGAGNLEDGSNTITVKQGEQFTVRVEKTGDYGTGAYIPGTDYNIIVYRTNTETIVDGISVEGNNGMYTTAYLTADSYDSTNDYNNDYTILIKPVEGSNAQYIKGKKFYVHVTKAETATVPVTGIKWVQSTNTMNVGDTYQFEAVVEPSNATNQKIRYTTTEVMIAAPNTSGEVKAYGAGTTTIGAWSDDGEYSVTCELTVTENSSFNIYLNKNNYPTGTSMNNTTQTKEIGEDFEIIAFDDTTNTVLTSSITSSNESVATVSTSYTRDSSGNYITIMSVQPIGNGTTKISVTSDGVTKSFDLNVTGNTITEITLADSIDSAIHGTIYRGYNTLTFYSDKDATTEITKIEPPTKTGYKFLGYYGTDSSSGSEGKLIDEEGTIIKTSGWLSMRGNELKAKWELQAETFLLNSYDATTAGTTKLYYSRSSDYANKLYLDSNLTKDIVSNPITLPTKTGYKFKGYYATTDNSYNDELVIDENGKFVAMHSGFGYQSATAKWEEITITGISVSANPSKTTYIKGESLDLTGGKIKVTYDDGETEEIPMTSSEVSVTGYDKDTTGTQELTVTYKEKTAKFSVTVEEKNIGFEVEAAKDNKDNKIVKVIITDTEREVSKVTVDDTEIEENEEGEYIFTPTKNGNYTIKVTYTDGTAETYVYTEERLTDEERTITGISVSSKPTKTTYTEGESLDLTGGKIKVTYADGETEDVSMTSSEVSVTGYDKNSIGTQELTVTYKDKTAKFEVTVEKLKDGSETETPSQNQVYPGKETDTTTAGKVIPKAGVRASIIIAAISIGVCAVFFKIKSERIDK